MTTASLDIRWEGRIEDLSDTKRQAILDRASVVTAEVRQTVAGIRDQVASGGDKALVDLTKRFDDVALDGLRVPTGALEAAHDQADEATLAAFRTAVEQLTAYHRTMAQAPEASFARKGVTAHEHRVPLQRVGIYVPGGRAAYPSTVAMTVIPAQAAGVDEIVVASPPGPDGLPHPLVLAACHELGVEHIVPVGGAQAIVALAQGTDSVPSCDAVVGPGNAYVQAAKELVAGQVRIDAPAGPSEIAVLVHPSANIHVAAAELIAQAEHDPASVPIAVCLGEGTALRLLDAVEERLEDLPRAETVTQALADQGAILVADDVEIAAGFLDDLAPEHCLLLHPDATHLAEVLTGPACIVLGKHGRVPLTDYVAGPSHVLPTGGHARAYSGVGVDTFTKRVHVTALSDVDDELAEAAAHLARVEGLEGHARAIEEDRP